MTCAVGRFRVPTRPAAVPRYFLEELHSPRSGRERIAARLARGLPPAAGLRLLARITPRSGDPGDLGLEPHLESHFSPPGSSRRAGFGAIELRGHGGRDRSLAFVFPPRSRTPRWVLKIASGERARAEVVSEAELMSRIRAALPPGLAGDLPEVLGVRRIGERTSVATVALPGRPLLLELARSGANAERLGCRFRAAGEWLGRFHRATAEATALPELVRAHLPGGDRAAPSLPVGRSHGDYWPRNVLFDAATGRLSGVVDWEASARPRLPHGDLFDFALSSVGCAPGPGGTPAPERVLGLALLEPGPRRALVTEFLAGYVRVAGIERSALAPLLKLYLEEVRTGARTLPWVPSAATREVIERWCNELETASPSAFSG